MSQHLFSKRSTCSWEYQSDTKIVGRAYRAYFDSEVELELIINEQKVGQAVANKFNPIPHDVKQPRDGNIGFEFDLSKLEFKNVDNVISVSSIDNNNQCGFGFGVYADGEYSLTSKDIPESYIDTLGNIVKFQ